MGWSNSQQTKQGDRASESIQLHSEMFIGIMRLYMFVSLNECVFELECVHLVIKEH